MHKTKVERTLKVYIANPFKPLDENEVISNTTPEYLIKWLNYGNIEMSNFVESDIVVFSPGSNVNPAVYGQKPLIGNDYNKERDNLEMLIYKRAVKLDKFMIGIDRGAILLTALNNGNVIQFVNHHNVQHKIKCAKTGDIYTNVPSQHTHMMFPYNLQPQSFEVIAFSKKEYFVKKAIGFEYLIEERAEKVHKRVPLKYITNFKEPKMVYYPRNGCFAIQFNCAQLFQESQLMTYVNNQVLQKYLNFQFNKLTKNSNNNEETDRNTELELGGWFGH